MRGAFQVGALRTFYNRRVIPHYIAGVSAGTMNGAAFAAGKMGDLYATYEKIARQPRKYVYHWNVYALLRAFFRSESFLINSPLQRAIAVINMQDLIASPIKLDIITSDYQSGKPFVFSNKNPEHQKTDILTKAILGSLAVPTVFPPFKFKEHQLFDGGVLAQAPLTYAIKEFCDTIFVISNNRVDSVQTTKLYKTIYAIGRRTATLVEWMTTKRTISRAFETNADIDAYLRLKKEVADRVIALAKNKDNEEAIRNAVEKAFSESDISIRSKLKVRLYILSPDPSDERIQSERLIDHKIIPHLLERGERDANALLDRLEKELL